MNDQYLSDEYTSDEGQNQGVLWKQAYEFTDYVFRMYEKEISYQFFESKAKLSKTSNDYTRKTIKYYLKSKGRKLKLISEVSTIKSRMHYLISRLYCSAKEKEDQLI